jgi:hypothetical protein
MHMSMSGAEPPPPYCLSRVHAQQVGKRRKPTMKVSAAGLVAAGLVHGGAS